MARDGCMGKLLQQYLSKWGSQTLSSRPVESTRGDCTIWGTRIRFGFSKFFTKTVSPTLKFRALADASWLSFCLFWCLSTRAAVSGLSRSSLVFGLLPNKSWHSSRTLGWNPVGRKDFRKPASGVSWGDFLQSSFHNLDSSLHQPIWRRMVRGWCGTFVSILHQKCF